MAHKKIPRNSPCPCGSGKKYKKCCFLKSDAFAEEAGTVSKSVLITEETRKLLEEQRRKFVEKHGRKPGSEKQNFSDLPDQPGLERQTVAAMKRAGVAPAIIYAYEETGWLVTEETLPLLPEAALAEWNAAIEEYNATKGHKKPPQFPLGTVIQYGPDDIKTTKIAAGVILHEGAEPILERWVATDVTTNPKVQREMKAFFKKHGVKSVIMSEGNYGCPHEEGADFPEGGDCPFCPFWKGKQGSNS